jgi:hypothetical protein
MGNAGAPRLWHGIAAIGRTDTPFGFGQHVSEHESPEKDAPAGGRVLGQQFRPLWQQAMSADRESRAPTAIASAEVPKESNAARKKAQPRGSTFRL